jgi:hypothetical protein
LTGQLMDAVDANSLQVLNERERKVADCVLGVSASSGAANTKALTVSSGANIGSDGLAIPVVQDGLEFFPYQKGIYGTNVNATTVAPESQRIIANYANSNETDGVGLVDYQAVVRALQTLCQNRDPWTGLPVPISLQGMTLFCSEPAQVQLKALLQQVAMWQIANSGLSTTGGTNMVSDYNYLASLGLTIKSSQIWVNRLVDVGITKVAANGTYAHQALTNAVTDTYATAGSVMSAFWMGRFTEAVHYAQRQPFTSEDIPLSSRDYEEETVLIHVCRERGFPYWVNPRVVWRAWK